MSYGNPDNKDIVNALEKMQRQLDDMQKKIVEMQESHRLFSPEHIIQAIGYSHIKDDLKEIKRKLGVD